MTAGFTIITVCGAALAELLDAVHDNEDLALLDQPVTAWIAGHRTPA